MSISLGSRLDVDGLMIEAEAQVNRESSALVQVGRPSIKVDRAQLSNLLSMNFTWSEISSIIGVSVKTLQRRAKGWNLTKFTANLTDSQVDDMLRNVLKDFPASGEVMLAGHLKASGIILKRQRLRHSIHRIRGFQLVAARIQRRVYNVPGPNYLWHADGNHKLIRYRLVIHGAIDGFSRLVTFLKCSDNNRADTVHELFISAITEFEGPY